jgi:hypothetical protein
VLDSGRRNEGFPGESILFDPLPAEHTGAYTHKACIARGDILAVRTTTMSAETDAVGRSPGAPGYPASRRCHGTMTREEWRGGLGVFRVSTPVL